MSKPTCDGLVRSNFWKGRQRLNRLYRWIANVVRPKIDWPYYAKPAPKTILSCDFLVPAGFAAQGQSPRTDTILSMRDFVAGWRALLTCGGIGRAAMHH